MLIKKGRNSPTFSIVIPTYNRLAMLNRAIMSICRQTFKSFEIIVVDDGSQESCSTLLSNFKNLQIHLITNSSNMGAAESRNIALQIARGKYISFLDDDDEYLDSFLENTYKRLENSPQNVGCSWCGVRQINYCRDLMTETSITKIRLPVEFPNRITLLEEFISSGIGWGVTFKSKCLKEIGTFNSNLKMVEDTDIFLRFLVAGFLPMTIPGIHMILHNHRQNRLTSEATYNLRIEESEILLEQYIDFFNKYPTLKNIFISYIERLKNI